MVFSCCFAPTVSGVPEVRMRQGRGQSCTAMDDIPRNMGCPVSAQGPPESWSKADVKQWFKHEGLQYTAATAVDGKVRGRSGSTSAKWG